MKLTVINRSKWPEWFVRPVCRWIASRAEIKWEYTLTLVGCSDRSMLAGRGARRRSRVRIHRRFKPSGGWPYMTKYWRYKWSRQYALHNRIEAFVDIVAHEMYHATGGHPDRFTRNGRCDDQSMEMACERFAEATVEAFRLEWASRLKPAAKAALRASRAKAKAIKKSRSDPSPKLTAAQKKLIEWQRRAKAAANRVKKYQRKVRYYEGRLAARAGQKEAKS